MGSLRKISPLSKQREKTSNAETTNNNLLLFISARKQNNICAQQGAREKCKQKVAWLRRPLPQVDSSSRRASSLTRDTMSIRTRKASSLRSSPCRPRTQAPTALDG